MKKMKVLSALLCLLTLLQCIPLQTSATEMTDSGYSLDELFQAAQPLNFGEVQVENGCRTIEGKVPLAGSGVLLETAQAAFLYEMDTETVVYAYNPDMEIAPGSLTKLVTGYIVLQHCELDEQVTLTGEIHKLPANARQTGYLTGEEVTVRDLMYSMLLDGCAQACNGLASYVTGGSIPEFISMMNEWVQSLGCTATRFENVHGLDNKQNVTTAREMIKIGMAAIQDKELYDIISSLDYEIAATNKNEARSFRTNNYMIDTGTIEDFRDQRVIGGVASQVPAYGASLICTAEYKGMNLIAVVLNCERRNQIVDGVESWRIEYYGNFNEMTKLLKMGFDHYKVNRIVYKGMPLAQFVVANGECNVVGQADVNIDSVVPVDAQMGNLYMKFDVQDGLSAPIKKNDRIATMQIEYRNSVLAEAEVFAAGNVTVAGNNDVTIHSTAARSDSSDSGILSVIGTICVIFLGIAAAYLTFNAYMRNRIRARRRKRRSERRRNH